VSICSSHCRRVFFAQLIICGHTHVHRIACSRLCTVLLLRQNCNCHQLMGMCVCTHTHTHTRRYTNTHTHTHTHTHTYTHMSVQIVSFILSYYATHTQRLRSKDNSPLRRGGPGKGKRVKDQVKTGRARLEHRLSALSLDMVCVWERSCVKRRVYVGGWLSGCLENMFRSFSSLMR